MSARLQWLLAVVFWSFVAGLLGSQILSVGAHSEIRRIFTWQVTFYIAWIPLTVAMWHAIFRWPALLPTRVPIALAHVVAAVIVGVVHAAIVVPIAHAIAPAPAETVPQMITGQIRGRIYTQVIIYAGVLASGMAMVMYGRWRDESRRTALLEARLAEARLKALRAQLHPHLLFNSLHAVASLVREERNAEAVKLIADMSELLRRVLDDERVWHSLDEELTLARTYLEVQRVRFEERLTYTIEAASNLRTVEVPVLTLQPLVENSIRHGFADKVGPGHLEIRATDGDGHLILVVRDNGSSGEADMTMPKGTGLANLQARLSTLYHGRAELSTESLPGGGFEVTIRLPRTRA